MAAIEELYQLVGQAVETESGRFVILDILCDTGEFVVQGEERSREIQTTAYGDPLRRVPATLTLPIVEADSQALHPILETAMAHDTASRADWSAVRRALAAR